MSGFHLSKTQRTGVFIDGPNLYNASKTLNFDLAFNKLRDVLREGADLVRINYYCPVRDSNEYNNIHTLLDWLSYNGFNVITKPIKEFTDSMGRRKFKGSLEIEMTIDIIELSPRLDHVIMFTGDADFRALVEYVQRHGTKVSVVSEISMVSDDLRRQADHFIDLKDIYSLISREHAKMDTLPQSITQQARRAS